MIRRILGGNRGGGGILPFMSTWKTDNTSSGSSTSTQIKLPFVSSGLYDCVVDWGDGSTNTITVWNQSEVTHTYSSTGVKTITITGQVEGWAFSNSGDRLKFLSVQSWGSLKLREISACFHGCANLNLSSVADVLDVTGITSLTSCFYNCTSLTTINRINEWSTGHIIAMSNMFRGCANFNQNLSFDTGNVTNFVLMFGVTNSFNGVLTFNTIKATTMQGMFNTAIAFNKPVNFNTENVTTMREMFNNASNFNQTVNFNTAKVTDMAFMFQGATAFNQNVGNLNITQVMGLSGFMNGKTNLNYSSANYDALLIGWSSQTVKPNVPLNMGTIKHTSAATSAKAILTGSPNNWTITDGGLI